METIIDDYLDGLDRQLENEQTTNELSDSPTFDELPPTWEPRTGQALILVDGVESWHRVIERVRPMARSKFIQVQIVGTERQRLVNLAHFRPD